MAEVYPNRWQRRPLPLKFSNDLFDAADISPDPAPLPPFKGRFVVRRPRRLGKLLYDLALFNLGVILDAFGLFVLLFVLVGGLTLDGFFTKTATVSFAFLFGTPEQQAEIRTQVLCCGLLFFNLAVILRAGSLKALFDAHRGGRHGR